MEKRVAKTILKLIDLFVGDDDKLINNELKAVEEWVAEYIWNNNYHEVGEIKDKLELIAFGEVVENQKSFFIGKLHAIIELIDFLNIPIMIEKKAKDLTELEKRIMAFVSQEEEVCPSQVIEELDLSKQHASNLLRKLKEKDLINISIVGRMRWYSLSSSGQNVYECIRKNAMKLDSPNPINGVIEETIDLLFNKFTKNLEGKLKKIRDELANEFSQSIQSVTNDVVQLIDNRIHQSVSHIITLNRSVLEFRKNHKKDANDRGIDFLAEFDTREEWDVPPSWQSLTESRLHIGTTEFLFEKISNSRMQQQVNSLIEAKSGFDKGKLLHEISQLKIFNGKLLGNERNMEEYRVEFIPTYGGVRA